jgi:hypothetical protein
LFKSSEILRGMHDRNQPPRAVDKPEPGWFEMRLVRGGPLVAAAVYFENGLWQAAIDGKLGPASADPALADGVFRIWHGAERCDREIFEFRRDVKTWAMANDPSHPAANPREVIDLHSRRPLF